MAVFFEGRCADNSEYNIEVGDGGDMTCMVAYFIGWLFFLKNPVFFRGVETTNQECFVSF